ncbi:26S proteasome non-ATPase regulatory subunit 3 [Armadillidium vulgare]|nr:26S proteasome non-ATPase regulatory subunit 3 [Armadillidium vulgare]
MLILRLRHNVIKTGLRSISLSYSKISLADVAQKLMLGSKEDAEFIVAKAIRDGVIEERREREQQDLELAKEMAEEDDDGFP